jgi:acyl-CoA synthetase (AMP-forming)/AMP-acid ligase II/acyl carrier protein
MALNLFLGLSAAIAVFFILQIQPVFLFSACFPLPFILIHSYLIQIFMQTTYHQITDFLQRNAALVPDKMAFQFSSANQPVSSFTYKELNDHAHSVAAMLCQQGKAGDRVLLMFPSGLEFIAAFFGTLYAGMIAVPTYTPKKNSLSDRVDLIVSDCDARFILTTQKTAGYLQKNFTALAEMPGLDIITWETITMANLSFHPPVQPVEQPAFLQYTSGSTGQPKGVIVTHRNLLANLEDLYEGAGQHCQSVMVSWLPVFHDLGLIAGILLPVYGGFTCHLMSPVDFLVKPLRWLKLMASTNATHTVAPNFAFDLCIKQFNADEMAGVDLRSVQYMGNCAEPVRMSTITAFMNLYSAYHLKADVIKPGYGLAEATLKVSSVPMHQTVQVIHADAAALEQNEVKEVPDTDVHHRVLVGCGSSEINTKLLIADPHTMIPCAEGSIGEVWVSGDTVAAGYWNNTEKTESAFHAMSVGETDTRYLRTGDLGFMQDGNLFITGRMKDLIIINGANHYPQDIELSVEESHPALRKGQGAAFSVDKNAAESLVIVYEMYSEYEKNGSRDEIFDAIIKAVSRHHGIPVHTIVLVKPSSIPKTSSGKVRRSECRRKFLEGSLSLTGSYTVGASLADSKAVANSPLFITLEEDEITANVRMTLEDTLKRFFNRSNISFKESIYQLGIDSITAVRLVHDLEISLQVELSPDILFEVTNLDELVSKISEACQQQDIKTGAVEELSEAELDALLSKMLATA